MLREAFGILRRKRYVVAAIVYFAVFATIYHLLDRLNGSYAAMRAEYGAALVAVNIALNVAMAAASALMMSLSAAYAQLSGGKEGKGTFLGSVAVFFGMLTYGCTSCVIAFFATVGITLTVAILPLAGLPYKLISLFIVLLGLGWLMLEIKRGRCRTKPKPEPEHPASET